MRTAGQMPGLRFFEGEEGDVQPGLWDRVKTLFSAPPRGFVEDALDQEVGGYDDVSGSGWNGEDTGLELEDLDDLGEVLLILGIGAMIAGLLWLRGRWTVREEERRRRAEREAVQGPIEREQNWAQPVPGMRREQAARDTIPEPLIDAPIP